MRVLLVQAFTALDMELVYPLGLAYLATGLRGHHVEIFDVNLHRKAPFDALEQKIKSMAPDVVGVSFRNMKVGMPHLHTDDIEPQRLALKSVRRAAPGIPIVGGGTAFSLYSEPLMERLPQLDFGLWGEGEDRFPMLLRYLEQPWKVPGVYYRKGGAVRFSGPPDRVDFTSLGPPRRDLLPLGPYAASSFVSVGVQAKRGCVLRCIHCSDTYLAGNTLRMRRPVDVVDEVEELVKEHGVRQMFFCDQMFNIPPAHAIEICQEMVRRRLDVKWSAWFNESRAALPHRLLTWLKRAGCGMLSFSPDHVDDRMLLRLRKNFRHEDLLYTWEIAKKYDMDVEYSFFLNAPGEDWRSLARLLVFLARARWHLGPRLRMFSLLLMQPIRIYPHTPIRELAIEAGLVDPDDDLVEGRYWNPGTMRHAVAGVQSAARLFYQARQTARKVRGSSFDSVLREE